MNITEADQEAIAQKVVERMQSSCACRIGPEAQNEMGHLFGAFKDEGNGDYSRGIELLRRVLRHFKFVDRATIWIARALLTSVVLGIIAGIWKLISLGMTAFLKGAPSG